MSLTALCYNWGFFTVLGYAPFPMNLSPIKLGLVFTGWGIFVVMNAWDVYWRPEITEEDIQHEIKRQQEHEHGHG